jgi:hypothetical protein
MRNACASRTDHVRSLMVLSRARCFLTIAVIYSCLPLIFLNAVVSPLLISTFEGKVVPRAKPVLSTLKIASEG